MIVVKSPTPTHLDAPERADRGVSGRGSVRRDRGIRKETREEAQRIRDVLDGARGLISASR
jgi:hypothetical protein